MPIIICAISILAYLLPRWSTFLKYGKTELTPPTPGEIPQAIAQAVRLVTSATTFQFRHTPVRVGFKLLTCSRHQSLQISEFQFSKIGPKNIFDQ